MDDLHVIKDWLLHQNNKEENRAVKAGKGFMALFAGPSATSLFAIAASLGKESGKEVHRIDVSQFASKYIGETEKNLAALFQKAENKGWILFLDEADALFGKRTDIKDAHDKYANRGLNYVLQTAENFMGLVIFAVKTRQNIDEAFLRRFQVLLHFPK